MKGKLVKLVGTVVDILQLEMFPAIDLGPNKQPRGNFFLDHMGDFEYDFNNCVYYERNIAVVKLERTPFSKLKTTLGLQQLYDHKLVQNAKADIESGKIGLPIFVKTYAVGDSNLLVGSLVEIVGFFNLGDDQQTIEEEPLNEKAGKAVFYEEQFSHSVDPAYAPTVHAVSFKPIDPFFSSLPLLKPSSESTFRKLCDIFTQTACGDALVGTVTLLSVASTISCRPYGTAIDILPLNVYDIHSKTQVVDFVRLMSVLCPLPQLKEVKIQQMNSEKWYGKKNYDLNCIENNHCFEPGTTLMLDEVDIEVGQLVESGVKNVNLINSIIQNQKIYFDFDYCNFEAEGNCNVICFSNGRSIFDFPLRVL